MAKAKRTQKKSGLSLDTRIDIVGVMLVAIGLLTGLSLLPANHNAAITLWLDLLRWAFGWGIYGLPIALVGLGVWLLIRRFEADPTIHWFRFVGLFFLFITSLTALAAIAGDSVLSETSTGPGGLVGVAMARALLGLLGTWGTWVIVVALTIVGTILLLDLSLAEMRQAVAGWRQSLHGPALPGRGDISIRQGGATAEGSNGGRPATIPALLRRSFKHIGIGRPSPSLATEDNEHLSGEISPPLKEAHILGDQHTWKLPTWESVLESGAEQEFDESEIRHKVKTIEETLGHFGVPARVVEVSQGPVVTQFGVEPGFTEKRVQGELQQAKVKVSKISNLANDLALALAAPSIRIEAPVPGRSVVGIEVPNSKKNLVSLKGVMAGPEFRSVASPLAIALGKDVSGTPIAADLGTMPHLLIAGATGAGKSVCINSIIACLLCRNTPDQLQILMIDPKMVELTNYNGIPHLATPVVAEMERVVGVLRWATKQMEHRYRLFANIGARNLDSYNARMTEQGQASLPYMVIIIDELADLMMIAPEEVEKAVCRIAQMARATGIHLVIATQRPSVDVVTGLIKANFPARISFAVSSQVDSRVILDMPGAERLLGQGDMLFMAPDTSKIVRLQGCYVSDRELDRLIGYWRTSHGQPARELAIRPADVVQRPLWGDLIDEQKERDPEDELYGQALEVIRQQGRASASLLQRKLRIGYSRAARLIDLLEERGVVGPATSGGRAREVLLEPEKIG